MSALVSGYGPDMDDAREWIAVGVSALAVGVAWYLGWRAGQKADRSVTAARQSAAAAERSATAAEESLALQREEAAERRAAAAPKVRLRIKQTTAIHCLLMNDGDAPAVNVRSHLPEDEQPLRHAFPEGATVQPGGQIKFTMGQGGWGSFREVPTQLMLSCDGQEQPVAVRVERS